MVCRAWAWTREHKLKPKSLRHMHPSELYPVVPLLANILLLEATNPDHSHCLIIPDHDF